MENKIISEYKSDIVIGDKNLTAIIRAHEKPIRKCQEAKCYVRLEIMDGDVLWGEMNWPAEDVTNSEADAVFKDIVKRPEIYTCK